MTLTGAATNEGGMTEQARLVGKRALVTGGSRGIGAAIARRLAAEGAAVAINYIADQSSADKLVAELTDKGHQVAALMSGGASWVPDVSEVAGGPDTPPRVTMSTHAHLRAQPTGEAGPRGREHLVVDEA
jgi:NAD(P)-dependent dehydrogenase (short-subunit alcohol dehydrogenase family)